MDTKTQISSLAEIKVIAKLIEQGYEVFIQTSGKAPFDLVAFKDGRLIRIEVKSTSTKKSSKGSWQIPLRRIRTNKTKNTIYNFDKNRCDVLAIYIHEIDAICFVNANLINTKTSIHFRENETISANNSWIVSSFLVCNF